jgi:hypothetical protein
MPEDTITATHDAPIINVWRTTDRLEASHAFEDDEATLTRSLPRTRAASASSHNPPSPFVVVVVVVKYEDDDDDVNDDAMRDHLFSLSANARPTQSDGVGAFDAFEDDDVNDDKELPPPRFVETT